MYRESSYVSIGAIKMCVILLFKWRNMDGIKVGSINSITMTSIWYQTFCTISLSLSLASYLLLPLFYSTQSGSTMHIWDAIWRVWHSGNILRGVLCPISRCSLSLFLFLSFLFLPSLKWVNNEQLDALFTYITSIIQRNKWNNESKGN